MKINKEQAKEIVMRHFNHIVDVEMKEEYDSIK
jgi:hypothetical protein